MDDLISRRAAIDTLYHVDEYNGRSIEAIRNLPSAQPRQTCEYWDSESNFCALYRPHAQPERKRGKWKLNKEGNWACPFCEFDPYHDNMKGMNYCPNCGAEMKGEEDETDVNTR